MIELLSVRPPPPEKKMKLLKEIAEEHELDWDPAVTEEVFFKPHEDLLVRLSSHSLFLQFLSFTYVCIVSLTEWPYAVC